MKFWKSGAALAVLALSLVGCGDGGVQSPDFTPELLGIEVSPTTATVVAGETVDIDLYGIFSTPPGSDADSVVEEIQSGGRWESDDADIATVDDAGVVTGESVGVTTIRVDYEGYFATAVVTVDPAVVRSLVIRTLDGSEEATASAGENVALYAYGVYSDGEERLLSNAEFTVAWESLTPSIATVDPEEGITTTASALAVGATQIRASLFDADTGNASLGADGQTQIFDLFPLTVDTAVLLSLSHIQIGTELPAEGEAPEDEFSVQLDSTLKFYGVGLYSDGSSKILTDDQMTWMSSDEALASIDADGAVTGVSKGVVTITGTLADPNSVPVGNNTSDTAELTVVDLACTNPARDTEFTAEGWFMPVLCLLCTVTNEANVIDDDDTNYAEINTYLGLLGGEAALNVTLNDGEADLNTGADPQPVGFLIGIDSGSFPVLNLELFSTLRVNLYGSYDSEYADEVASSGAELNPLELDLLGLQVVPGIDLVSVQFTPPADTAFRRMRLAKNVGVASVNLSDQGIRVFNACLPD